MTSFPQAIAHALRNLLRFDGRDTRSQFWFYVLGLVLAQQVASVLAIIPLFFGVFGGLGHTSVSSDPIAQAPDPAVAFAPFHLFVAIAIVLTLFRIFLLAASVARRLHDSGLRGWWGLLPVPFLLIGLGAFVSLTSGMGHGDMPGPSGAFDVMLLNNAVYLLMLVVLIVLLVRESEASANRYGPPPAGRV